MRDDANRGPFSGSERIRNSAVEFDRKSPVESNRERGRHTFLEYTTAFARLIGMDDAQPTPNPWDTLTAREQETALLLGRGEANREIANALGISIKTVDTHRGHLLKKLKLKNNAMLVLYLVREGKVTP